MAWTGQNFTVGQILTAAQMNNLQDDIAAAMNQDSGAPAPGTNFITSASQLDAGVVGQSEISANSVGQSELKRSTASQSTSVSANSTATISLSGGSYTMGWFIGTSISGVAAVKFVSTGDTYATKVAVEETRGGDPTVYLYSLYVPGSPPYSLGYGEIPKFILVQIDKSTGDVIGTYSAEDPPWAYHGPHDCHPINSILLRSVGLWGVDIREAMKIDPDATLEKLKAMRELRQDNKRLQQAKKDYALSVEDKNIDMDAVPHLFSDFDPSKHVAVMLDPCSKLTEKLSLEDEFTSPEFSISNLLHDGYINIDNNALAVRSPAGVITAPFSMKLTRG